MSIADKLQTLVENIPKTFRAGRLNPIVNSTYCNGKVSDTIIAINDVLPIEHSVGCKLELRNLYDNTRTDWGSPTDDYSPLPIFVGAGNTVKVSYETNIQPSENNPYLCVYTENTPSNQVPSDCWLTHKTYEPCIHKSVTLTATEDYIYLQCSDVDLFKNGVGKELKVEIISLSFSDIEVSRYGKNIFNQDVELPKVALIHPDYASFVWKKQDDGSFFSGNIGTMANSRWWENTSGYTGQMSLSFTAKTPDDDTGELALSITFLYTDGTNTSVYVKTSVDYKTYTLTSVAGKTVSYIKQSYQSYGGHHYIKDVMIAYGTDTEYEPYIEPTTYTANTDGTVEDVTSIAPNMTLLTNNNGAVINCNYYKDPDIVISNLMQNVALSGGESQ